MASKQSGRGVARSLSQWRKLAKQFAGHPQLKCEVLYALPLDLIRSLRKHAPKVLSASDAKFETRLRQLSSTGFYRKQPMFSDVLDGRYWDTEEFELEAVSDRKEREERRQSSRFREALSSDRSSPALWDRRQKILEKIEGKLQLRMRGYAGWLVTQPEYWCDVFDIEQAAGLTLESYGAYPPLTERFSFAFEDADSDLKDAWSRLRMLKEKWSLESFTTFEIPEPLRPGFNPGDRFDPGSVKPDGLALFLPWPLLADNWLTMRELYDYHELRTDLGRFSGWLKGASRTLSERSSKLFELFVYLRWVLEERYAEGLEGQAGAVNRAFGNYFKTGQLSPLEIEREGESVRKLRGILKHRIRRCEEAVQAHKDELASGEPTQAQKKFDASLQELEQDVARARAELQGRSDSGRSGSRQRRASS